MKLLVFALRAQRGADAGRIGFRAVCNGIRGPFRESWRLYSVAEAIHALGGERTVRFKD